MKKQGFTLVELSIVLVIIGLLIGGILVAQSMISTAKIQGVIRQLSQYDAAISNFQTKYNQLPGDSSLIPIGGYVGNNNGLIEEETLAWPQLSLGTGLKNYQGNNFSFLNPYTQAACPQLNIDQDTSSPACLRLNYGGAEGMFGATSIMNPNKNYYDYYMPLDSTYYNAAYPDPLKAKDVLAIDQKIDDGLPGSGKVMAETIGLTLRTNSLPRCVVSGNYNSSASNYACTLYLELGFTGNGQ